MLAPATADTKTAKPTMIARIMRRPRVSPGCPCHPLVQKNAVAGEMLQESWTIGHGGSACENGDPIAQPASAPNCLMPRDRPRTVWFADARLDQHRDAARFHDFRNAHSAAAGIVEPLPAAGIRHRRISGALVRRLSRAQPFAYVRPVSRRRMAALFLADRGAAGRSRSLGHRPVAEDAPFHCLSDRLAGDDR